MRPSTLSLALSLLVLSACQGQGCASSSPVDTAGDGGAEDGGSDSGDTGPTTVDADEDGFPSDQDCDDDDPDVNPGVEEVPGNGVDEDCDGSDAGPTQELSDAATVWEGETYSMSGKLVEYGGDIDGDGVSDLLVGAPWEAVPGEAVDYPGAVYVVPQSLDSGPLDAASAVIVPDEANAGTGRSIAGGADLNNDGYDDVVIGMYASEIPPETQGGRALLFLGPLTGVLTEADADAQVRCSWEGAQSGYGQAMVPIDATLAPHWAVGAPADGQDRPGEVFIWHDIPSGVTDETSASVRIVGTAPDAQTGISIEGGVDLTGDGIVDLVISEAESSVVGVETGAAHIVPGPLDEDITLGTDSISLLGTGEYSNTGRHNLPHPDTNGDGYADLLVSAPLDPQVDVRGGKVWLLHGPLTAGGMLDDLAAAAILPESGYEWLGRGLAAPDDLDGDGLLDLAISAPRDFYFGADLPGKVYLFPSTIEGTLTGADASRVLQGESFGDYAGADLASGFDLDGDGRGDLAVGAPMVNGAAGTASGRVYLVTGLAL